MKPFMNTTPDFGAVIDINFKGVLNTTHAVAANMIERMPGKIINIASDVRPGWAAWGNPSMLAPRAR
ncbi:MAG: SDR family NAD(P)-dependent oxidoreductase [Desulfobacterales bacterium]